MIQNKLIIFDLDGVLVDTEQMASEYFRTKYPTVTVKLMKEILTGNFHDEWEKAKLTHQAIEETDEEKTLRSADYSAKKETAGMFPGILELLLNLHKKGYILTINTSALERNCIPLLNKLNILDLFDFVATAEVSKSKVEKFKMIEEKYKFSKENTFFITDTLGDIREANRVGVRTIAVTWGAHDRTYFSREKNENLIGIVDTVSELEKIIETR